MNFIDTTPTSSEVTFSELLLGSHVFVCLQCRQFTYCYLHTPAGLLFSIYYNTSEQSVYVLTSPVQHVY